MRSRLGPSSEDPFMKDIREAAAAGHFDARRDDGPSRLELTPVDDLYATVSTMSTERRKIFLAQLGRVRHGRTTLSGKKENSPRRSKRTWLSR